MIREPVVAGKFYPDDPEILKQTIKQKVVEVEDKLKARGVVSPHAGYFYSGKVAVEVFSSIEIPKNIIIIGPNHQGIGNFYSLSGADHWATPLGITKVNKELIETIIKYTPYVYVDETAHMYEHSIEVQLPIIQYFREDISIVPFSIMGYDLKELLLIGKGLKKALENYDEDVLIVASTDFSHYVPQREAEEKDHLAIEKILRLDPEGLWRTVKEKRISMCGVAPVTIMIESLKDESLSAKLIKYTTSAEASGDATNVVGYAGIVLY